MENAVTAVSALEIRNSGGKKIPGETSCKLNVACGGNTFIGFLNLGTRIQGRLTYAKSNRELEQGYETRDEIKTLV